MDAVDEVKNRLNIEDVIGEYVNLKRTGRNYKGLSPFTSEKTPSFVVSPEKQIWKDFSSGKGGSMFDFVMEVEGLDFKGALELLARKAGVDLEQYKSVNNRSTVDKEKLYQLLELCTKFYQVQFSKNDIALDYVLNSRNYTKETALKWRLGYAPNNGTSLIDFAKKRGFTTSDIKLAGLSSNSYGAKDHDMFRSRLMIPLQDLQGRVIGFTARLLEANIKAPKYINTPQSPLYDKSRHVYGLHLAKEAIRKNQFAVLVEGNLDVIASHQAGVTEAVATAGTALTEPHLKTLSRLTNDVRLCFDSDKAGIAATERAIPIASKTKVSLSIVDLNDAKDPDELIQKDANLWREAIKNNVYALDWLIDRYKLILDITSAQGKRKFSDILLPVINSLSDSVEKDHYINLLANLIDISRPALTQKLNSFDQGQTPIRKNIKINILETDKAKSEFLRVQDRFLSLMLMRPTLREFINDFISIDMLVTDDARLLYKTLKNNPEFDEKKIKTVQNIGDYVKIEVLLYEELYQGLELNELYDEAARLQAELVTKFVKTQKAKLSHAQKETSDEAVIRSLQEKDKHYNLLLNQVKGAAHG